MLVDTHASKNDKTPRVSYSFKGSCKTSEEVANLPAYIISVVKW